MSGEYVEARTAEVFTGGCIMGSEAETMGKQAVLAWKVDRGSFNGVSLDGLSVVAAVAGDRNLGIAEIGGGQRERPLGGVRRRSAPTAPQQIALVAMASELSKGIVGTIVQVTPAPIQFTDQGSEIQVSTDAGRRSTVNKVLTHDPTCGAMQWFHPFVVGRQATMGVTEQHVLHRLGARHEVERPEQALGVLRHVRVLAYPARTGRIEGASTERYSCHHASSCSPPHRDT